MYGSGAVPQNGLVAQYPMTDGSGTIVHDSARGHNGTVVGTQWGAGGGAVNSGTGSSGGGC